MLFSLTRFGVLLAVVRLFSLHAERLGVPRPFGALLAGILLGPHALGLFPAIDPALAALAQAGAAILLFSLGLETRFARAFGPAALIGAGGAAAAFALGALAAALALHVPLASPPALFLGAAAVTTSVSVTAGLLRKHRRADSPEGVTILTAALCDNALGVAAVTIVIALTGAPAGANGIAALAVPAIILAAAILAVAGSTLVTRLVARLGGGMTSDCVILVLGATLAAAGLCGNRLGAAPLAGAYVTGLALARGGLAPVIRARVKPVHEFLAPVFLAAAGMSVNLRDLAAPGVFRFAVVYTLLVTAAKAAGGGLPALALGFNLRGALSVGAGLAARGELALAAAAAGLAAGVLDQRTFAAVIVMTLGSALLAPALMSAAAGAGARAARPDDAPARLSWIFPTSAFAELAAAAVIDDLQAAGFHARSLDADVVQAWKDGDALTIAQVENRLTVDTTRGGVTGARQAARDALAGVAASARQLAEAADPRPARDDPLEDAGRTDAALLARITPARVALALKGATKEAVIAELVDLVTVTDRDQVLRDVLERERTMSTGMQQGIALPHAKSDGVEDLEVALGIKREGVDFDAVDGELSRIFILAVSPRKVSGPHIQFLAAVSGLLKDAGVRSRLLGAETPEEAAAIARGQAAGPAGPRP